MTIQMDFWRCSAKCLGERKSEIKLLKREERKQLEWYGHTKKLQIKDYERQFWNKYQREEEK